jgi:thiamine transport system ATP-binding protein
MSDLEVAGVTVRFGATTVLDRVSLDVADGEVVALVGPSGSGKSTLLAVIAGILAPDAGTIRLDRTDVTSTPTHRRGVGMVFQDDQLFPHMSVFDNVMFGPRMTGRPKVERRTVAEDWLRLVGLEQFGERSVTGLSGGESKRVALARTMAAGPSVVLLDEPLTGLDRELHDRLAADLAGLLRSAGTTAVLVTHDHGEADAVADRTVSIVDLHGGGVAGGGDREPTAGG